ncbi:KappaPI-stichotoxin-Shd2a [Bulinus truncatus]|nr:KappaPI-stichotoxin-Shd2a [Bulinus truncatus]
MKAIAVILFISAVLVQFSYQQGECHKLTNENRPKIALFILNIAGALIEVHAKHLGDVQDPICSLKPDPGFCKALFYRYYYDPSKGKCELFNYGGCRGNANNFESLEACEAACVEGKTTEAAPL